VEDARQLFENDAVRPVATRSFRISYVEAAELEVLAEALLTERGRTSVGVATNSLVVSDVPRVLDAVAELVETLDVRVRQVDIAAKIIFINRTGLEGFGITYDLKDTRGNQFNLLTPGVADTDGDGVLSLPAEQVPRGTDVVALGGNSIAALGNASDRIVGPTLSVLTSLVIGRSTLIGFIDALEAIELTNVEAQPSVRVMDNRTARILVGEETPVRVLDAGAQMQADIGSGSPGGLPVATVDYIETGVILEVAPRITDGGDILLDLSAERSSADLAPSDVGLTFRKQRAESQVLLKDGETVVIGGLTVREMGEVRSGIPLLMNLPLVGRLFATVRKSSVERDLLIMVTPTIVPGTSP
jgi:type IV pilus assembly protein PilQ